MTVFACLACKTFARDCFLIHGLCHNCTTRERDAALADNERLRDALRDVSSKWSAEKAKSATPSP